MSSDARDAILDAAFKLFVERGYDGTSGARILAEVPPIHAKFPQPELGSWIEGSPVVGDDYQAPRLEGWERPTGH